MWTTAMRTEQFQAASTEADCQSMELTKEVVTHSENSRKLVKLSLQLPPKPTDFSASGNHDGRSPVHSSGSSRGSPSNRGFAHEQSFENQISMDGERSSLLDSGHSATIIPPTVHESGGLATYMTNLAWKKCVSLPVTRGPKLLSAVSSVAKELACRERHSSQEWANPARVSRSLSVPARKVVILRSGSFPNSKEPMETSKDQISSAHLADGDEEIPEEDAVCRVCLEGLSLGRNSFKLECSCRGALGLMHEECALKWFSIKGNRKCDVCGEAILNLPVTLFQVQNPPAQVNNRQLPVRQSSISQFSRTWRDFWVLMLINTICYFFFLEEQLVREMKSQAILVATPFSFSLGLLASLFASFLACREYIWAYSAFQFALVATFLHLFYSMLRIIAVCAILFSAFAGFGVALGINSLVLLIFAGRHQNVQTRMSSNPV